MGLDVIGAVGSTIIWWPEVEEDDLDAERHAAEKAAERTQQAIDDARRAIVDLGGRQKGAVVTALAQNRSDSIGAVDLHDTAAAAAIVLRGPSHLLSPAEWALHPERKLARVEVAGNVLARMARLGGPIDWLLQSQANAAATRRFFASLSG